MKHLSFVPAILILAMAFTAGCRSQSNEEVNAVPQVEATSEPAFSDPLLTTTPDSLGASSSGLGL